MLYACDLFMRFPFKNRKELLLREEKTTYLNQMHCKVDKESSSSFQNGKDLEYTVMAFLAANTELQSLMFWGALF